MINDKLLFANLAAKETFLEHGRIFFSVLNAFSNSGYRILLLENEKIHNVDSYCSLIFDLKNLSIVNKKPEFPERYIYLYDQRTRQLNNMEWRKQIRLKYDLFSKYWFEQPIIMPFPVYPLQEVHCNSKRLSELRKIKSQFRVLFAGDVKDYKRRWINYPKEKLARFEIIETIKEKLFEIVEDIKDEKSFTAVMNSNYLNRFILIDNERQRIDNEIWLDTLAKAHFYLSPPGIVMSMCHNIVEAMAVGSIPITNYPEWFHPNLEHNVNCVVFDDKKDLIDQIDSVVFMDETKINLMKKNAIEYYEKYLKKEEFVKRVERYPHKKLTILYFTERNVAQRSKKLTKHSVLMRDTSIPVKKSGIRYQIMRFLGRA